MMTIQARRAAEAATSSPDPESLRVAFKGDWLLEAAHPHAGDLVPRLDSTPGLRRIDYETAELGDWDTGLVTFLVGLELPIEELTDKAGSLLDGLDQLVRGDEVAGIVAGVESLINSEDAQAVYLQIGMSLGSGAND